MALLGFSSLRLFGGSTTSPKIPSGFRRHGPAAFEGGSRPGAQPPSQTGEVSFATRLAFNTLGARSLADSGYAYDIPASTKVFCGMHIYVEASSNSSWGDQKCAPITLYSGDDPVVALAPVDGLSLTSPLGIYSGEIAHVNAPDAQTSSSVVAINTWVHLELGYDAATGEVTVMLDSVVVLSTTVAPSSDITSVVLGLSAFSSATQGGWTFTYDNFYVCNGAGGTNNTFLGSVIVREFKPTTVTADAGWVSESGGVPTIAKITDDNDSTLVRAIADDAVLTLTLDADVGTAKILAAGVEFRHSDSGTGILSLAASHGGNNLSLGTVSGGHADVRTKALWSETGPSGEWTSDDLDVLTVTTTADITP